MGSFENVEGASFTNRQDDPMYVDLRAGLTTTQDSFIRWKDVDQSVQFQIGMDSSGTFVMQNPGGASAGVSFSRIGINTTDFTAPSGKDVVLSVMNNNDADHEVTFRAGDGTVDRRMYLSFETYQGNQAWLIGRNSVDAFIIYNTAGTNHVFYFDQATGDTRIDSCGATGRVTIGSSTDPGTSATPGIDLSFNGTAAAPQINFGSGNNFRIYVDATNNYLYTVGTGRDFFIDNYGSGGSDLWFRCHDATNGDIRFATRGTTEKFKVDANGANLVPVGSDPGSPNDGNIWITTGGDLKFRANGTTYTVTAT